MKIESEKLDDLVAAWHDTHRSDKPTLQSWLEMNDWQYKEWVASDESPEFTEKQHEKLLAKWNKWCVFS